MDFILDRTLTPALREFGLSGLRLIDPACGSGHFLLAAFDRLFAEWTKREPAATTTVLTQRALDSVYGVDVNPYAVAVARFRLLIAALKACKIQTLANAPHFKLHLATGDSLLHGPRPPRKGGVQKILSFEHDPLESVFETEDKDELREILGNRYHAVVANPPYINVQDSALRTAYRIFESCSGKYQLSVPFTERLFDLARTDIAGFVGMITSNAFMKRSFGKKLIEVLFPRWDITHVIDTSGVYLPGHGTPTAIILGRNRHPSSMTVRFVRGIRGEITVPDVPSIAPVWVAITEQVDRPGSESNWVTVTDVDRAVLNRFPLPMGGGGAAELKERLDESGGHRLDQVVTSAGITSFTLEDDIYLFPRRAAMRYRFTSKDVREMVIGDSLRDWQQSLPENIAAFPYTSDFRPIKPDADNQVLRYLWPGRTTLANNMLFGGKTKVQGGLTWYEYGRLTASKLRSPLSIAIAFVATHNHFVLDRGGKVFKQSAPVIKLPETEAEADHIALLGIL